MKKIVVSFVLLLILICTVPAQDNRKSIYQAFINGNMESWKSILTTIESVHPQSAAEKLELISYYYGYIGYSLGVKNKGEAQTYLRKGEKLLSELSGNDVTDASSVYAFKSAFIGFRIGLAPLKAPFIGKSSIDHAKKALMIDSENIQANIEQANIFYYAPSAFGGDKKKAMEHYRKAISLCEEKPSTLENNWLYLSLLTQVAQIEIDRKEYDKARQTYRKILEIEPGYLYVKNELLPALEKKYLSGSH